MKKDDWLKRNKAEISGDIFVKTYKDYKIFLNIPNDGVLAVSISLSYEPYHTYELDTYANDLLVPTARHSAFIQLAEAKIENIWQERAKRKQRQSKKPLPLFQ